MMNENIVKKRAYRALIKSYGKHLSKEIRKAGFKFNSEFGSIFLQLEGFSMSKYEADNDI